MMNLPEELIFVLIVAIMLFGHYLMKRFGAHQPPHPHNEAVPEFPEQTLTAPEISAISNWSDTRFGRSESPSVSIAVAQRRFSRKSLMANTRDVQNAIVTATIMGRCRAFEPHDVR